MRGELTVDKLRFAPPRLKELLLAPFLKDRWGVAGEFKTLAGERDQNFRIRSQDGAQYVLKIASPIEDTLLVDFQVQSLLHVERTDPGVPVPRVILSLTGAFVETLKVDNKDFPVRLLSWIAGAPLHDFKTPQRDLIEQLGALQGRLCKTLQGFQHAGTAYFMPWNILNGLVESDELRTRYLRDGFDKRCAEPLRRLEQESLPAIRKLPTQVIHNDAHSGNVLCDPSDPDAITGVIDFGDQIEAPLIVDLCTSLASILIRSSSPLDDVAALVRGFERHVLLPEEQRRLLYDATLARSILTVQLLEYRVQNLAVDPELRDVDLPECKLGLDKIMNINPGEFLEAARS